MNAKYNLSMAGPYATSKAALNMIVAKYSAQYAADDVLFIAVAPGMVDTGGFASREYHPTTRVPRPRIEEADMENTVSPEQTQKAMTMIAQFKQIAPDFAGPTSIEESIQLMTSVWEKASVANGDGGSNVSQFGNKQWL